MKTPKLVFALLSIALMLVSCSNEEPEQPVKCVVDFENTGIILGGPSPYGENLYDNDNYDGSRFTKGLIQVSDYISLEFGLNLSPLTNKYEMYGGGIVLSQWNYRSDRDGDNEGWWKTYENQLSVYNASSSDGANRGAGYNGSNTFAIIYDAAETPASFNFTAGAECIIESIQICPTSYVYGVITQGNPFGNNPGQSLKEVAGWFKVIATGYDAYGNEVGSMEKYLCDYRNGANIVELATTWQSWSLSGLGMVNKVVFGFEGSDVGDYGLNTPSYLAIDNISVRLN